MRIPQLGVIPCVLILLFAGCDSQKTATKDSGPSQHNNLVRRPTVAEQNATRKKKPVEKKLEVKKLLEWTNLPEEVLAELRLHQTKGQRRIDESDFNEIRSRFDVLYVVQKRKDESWQPVLSTSEPQTDTPEYSDKPVVLEEMYRQKVKFRSLGVEHFAGIEIDGVPSDQKDRAEALFREIYQSELRRVEPDFWTKMRDDLKEIYVENPGIRKEPQLLYCMGWTNMATLDFEEADRNFYNAAKYISNSNYPARFAVDVFTAKVRNARYCVTKKNPGRRLAEYYLSVVYWLEHDFRAVPSEHRNAYALVERFVDECERQGRWDLLTQFMKDVSAQKHLPVWVRSMCRGKISREIAWNWRGSGYAGTVPKNAWKPFEQYQKIAAEEFERAHEVNPLFPESASCLIGISTTGHSEKSEDYWFEKAIEGQVDYMPAYRGRLFGLLPQWGGSVKEMFEFTKLHVDKDLNETQVPGVIVDFYDVVLRYVFEPGARKYLEKPEVAKCAIKALDGLLNSKQAHGSDSIFRNEGYLLTLKAIMAARGGVNDVACETFEKLGADLNEAAIEKLRIGSIGMLRGQTFALSGDHSEECQKMLDAMNAESEDLTDDQKTEVAEQCLALMKKVDNKYAANWLETIHGKLRFESEFALGMSAEFPFDESLSFWTCGDKSQFTSESNDSVLIDTSASIERVSLRSRVDTKGNAKTIEFDIEFAEKPGDLQAAAHFTPSVTAMNYRGSAFAFGLNRLYRTKRTYKDNVYQLGQFSFGWRDTDRDIYYYYTELNEGANQVRLQVAPGYFEAYLNDRFVCRSTSKEIKGALDVFEICQPLARRGRGKARVSGIRLENWHVPPPPIREGAEALKEYYKLQFEEDPTDRWAAFWYAQATHMSGDTEDAVELYMTAIDNGFSESAAAFFIGDCHDQDGNADEAIRWYRIAAADDNEDITELFKRRSSQQYSNPCHWAGTRLAWLMQCSPDESLRKSISNGTHCRIGTEDRHRWVEELLVAMGQANQGDFDKALQTGQRLIGKCSSKDKRVLNTVLNAWRSKEVYRTGEGELPLYLALEGPIPFFRCFEDYLDASWKGVY